MSTKSQIKSISRKERRLRAAKNKITNRKQVRQFRPKKGTVAKQAPLAEGYIRKYEKPKTTMTKTGITVAHREYVGSITSSDDLSFARLRINPSDPVTFPWLSTIAGAYEKFKIKKMKICYQKNCASITPGYVYMYPDYNVQRLAMNTETLFLNTMDVVETSPWVSTDLTIKPNKLNQLKTYLIRSPYEAYTDYLLYDPLNVFIGTAQSLANDPINIGRIFIDYEIELSVPDPETNLRLYSVDVHYTGMLTSLANGGGYLPDLTAPSTQFLRGNYPLKTQQNGFSFSDNFCGLIQIYFIGSGFDASRVPSFVAINGDVVLDGYDTQDEIGGLDVWSLTYWANMNRDSQLVYTNTASLTTSATTGVDMFVQFGSANPRWLSQPDPKITGAFGAPSLGLNAKQPKFLAVTRSKVMKKMSKSTKLSSKKKMFEVEDSD